MPSTTNPIQRVQRKLASLADDFRLERFGIKLARQARPDPAQAPLVFFNASTRLDGLSQNAAFAMLAGMGLQAAGTPVVYFACQAGMQQCVLGAAHSGADQPPPCGRCTAASQRIFAHAPTVWFKQEPEAHLAAATAGADLAALSAWTADFNGQALPLGELCLPGVRWALRRHDLANAPEARDLLEKFILSAWNIARQFDRLLERLQPQAVLVFNGIMYPEATARWVAQQRGVRVITHEVSFQPLSAFFTDGQATRYPIHIPADFELNPAQNARLDAYLEQRFQGKFTMAGIRFWTELRGLDQALLERMTHFRQVVPVFTNVIFDTSQVGTNTLFPDMFAWLAHTLEVIRRNPDTLFVIRAHPDENRRGKQSQQSVAAWAQANRLADLPNTVFIGPDEPLSSYELIARSKFVLVYNSSIGLEAALLGAAVLGAAAARFTQYPTVFLPGDLPAYEAQLAELLAAERIEVPAEFARQARRFLYYQLYRVSLPFGEFIEPSSLPGYVRLKKFAPAALQADHSATMQALVDGVRNHQPFMLPDDLSA